MSPYSITRPRWVDIEETEQELGLFSADPFIGLHIGDENPSQTDFKQTKFCISSPDYSINKAFREDWEAADISEMQRI